MISIRESLLKYKTILSRSNFVTPREYNVRRPSATNYTDWYQGDWAREGSVWRNDLNLYRPRPRKKK